MVSIEPIPHSSSSTTNQTTLNTTLILIENSQSPYYLNNGDNPGIRIVPDPLTRDNYQAWRRSMTIALSAKNKLGLLMEQYYSLMMNLTLSSLIGKDAMT